MNILSSFHHHQSQSPSPFLPLSRQTHARGDISNSYALGSDGMETANSRLIYGDHLAQNLDIPLHSEAEDITICHIRIVRWHPNPQAPDEHPLDWTYKQAILLKVPSVFDKELSEYHHVSTAMIGTYPMHYQWQTETNVLNKGLDKNGLSIKKNWMDNLIPEVSSVIATFCHKDIHHVRSTILSITPPTRQDLRTDVDWTHEVLAKMLYTPLYIRWHHQSDSIVQRLRSLGGNRFLWRFTVLCYHDLNEKVVLHKNDPRLNEDELRAELSESDLKILDSSSFKEDLKIALAQHAALK